MTSVGPVDLEYDIAALLGAMPEMGEAGLNVRMQTHLRRAGYIVLAEVPVPVEVVSTYGRRRIVNGRADLVALHRSGIAWVIELKMRPGNIAQAVAQVHDYATVVEQSCDLDVIKAVVCDGLEPDEVRAEDGVVIASVPSFLELAKRWPERPKMARAALRTRQAG